MITPETKQGSADVWFGFRRFAVTLGVTLALFHWKVLFGGESFFYRDFGVLAYPTTYYFKQSLLGGELPFWNPLSNSGAPFMAQWGTMVLYPFQYFLLLLPLPWGLNFFCIIHLWIAGLGMYKLADSLTSHRWAATAAGFSFVLSGIAQAAMTWPNYLVVLAWMPWLIYTIRQAWLGGDGKMMLWAGVTGFLQMMSGAPEIILLTWLAIGVIGIADLYAKNTEPKRWVRSIVFVVFCVTGLSAAQLLPFWELVQSSQRQLGVSSVKWALPNWGWANFILPMFHAFKTPQGTYFQEGQEFMASTYLGAAVLIAAGLSLRKKSAPRIALAVMLIFSALLALGPAGIVYQGLQYLFPGVGLARYPVKALYLVGFCVPLLLAYFIADHDSSNDSASSNALLKRTLVALMAIMVGLLWWARSYPLPYDRWPETLNNSLWRGLFALAALVLMMGGKNWKVPEQTLRFALLLVLAFDAKWHLPNLNPTLPSSFMQPAIWESAHDLRKPQFGSGRLFITPAAEERLLHSTIADTKADWMGKRLACWSHLNLLELAPKVNGSSTLQLAAQAQVQTMLYSTNVKSREAWLNFLGVTHQSSPQSYAAFVERKPDIPLLAHGFTRASFMSPSAILSNLPSLSVTNELYLPASGGSEVKQEVNGQIQVTHLNALPHSIQIRGHASVPGWVSISQSWEKNWQAIVNSAKADVLKANHAFQAVAVPQGDFSVELSYVPKSFRLGALISILTALWMVGSYFVFRKKQSNFKGRGEAP